MCVLVYVCVNVLVCLYACSYVCKLCCCVYFCLYIASSSPLLSALVSHASSKGPHGLRSGGSIPERRVHVAKTKLFVYIVIINVADPHCNSAFKL